MRNYSGYAVMNPAWLQHVLEDIGVPPLYPVMHLDHVTYKYPSDAPPPYTEQVVVVGHGSALGAQALVVEVGGTSVRPDGGTFHITYSCDEGVAPVISNAVLEQGWTSSASEGRKVVAIPVRVRPFPDAT